MAYIVVNRSCTSVLSENGAELVWFCVEEAQRVATRRNGLVRTGDGRIPLRCKCKRCESACEGCGGHHDEGVMCC